ncbi:MAG: sigma-54-dependent Fis family transcriptional regulator [Rhodocyclaceae bacterium]|nr:sigma-54-dependent Fis family transcriptional regulator [Rhodocyclaceae bacterium]
MNLAGESLHELLSFLDTQPEPRIVMDAEFRIVAANRAYTREFGQGRPVRGRRCYEVSHRFTVPCDQAGESCPLRLSLETGGPYRVLHLHHTPRGEEHVDVETTPIRDGDGELRYFVETLRVVKQASSQAAAEGLVGRSASFKHMLAQVMRVAPTDASVILLGATGTGKELVARLVHEASRRSGGPFVAVDCSGLTETLFESELFGYEKGAFTGANFRKLGLVEAASGGTLFLDEIGDVPMALQVKLLRLLETGTYRRVGGIEALRSDFRLVCATHRNLGEMVEKESFRRDLYHRIQVFPIHTPSLDQRQEDIPLLADSFLKRVAPERRLTLSEATVSYLQQRAYPGNIRELRNLIERATILADGSEIQPCHLEEHSLGALPFAPGLAQTRGQSLPTPVPPGAFSVEDIIPLDEVERLYLAWAEAHFQGDRKSFARKLGLSPRTLFRKLSGLEGEEAEDE